MDPVQHFSATDAEARARFFAAAKADGLTAGLAAVSRLGAPLS
jgi:hypothetical protein